MKKDQILKSLDDAIEKQVPDIWDDIKYKIQKDEKLGFGKEAVNYNFAQKPNKKRKFYTRLSIAAAACLIAISTFTFTPALAAIEGIIDQLFSSNHIDDTGLKIAMKDGVGQPLDQTFYDKKNDITVHFQGVMTDDKETKLLLTYQSKKTNLENYYVDIFEGKSSINLVVDGKTKKLNCVGWGSRYYDKKNNKVAEALSFESIKQLKGHDVHLEIKDLTKYDFKNSKATAINTVWPINFKLDPKAVTDRETVAVNKQFTFNKQNYTIKSVEFSAFETRVVVTGTDTKLVTDPVDGSKYHMMSKLEHQFLNARKISKDTGYTFDDSKSGIVLKSAGERAVPIFNKDEVEGAEDEYIMTFDPVKDRHDCVLEIGDNIKIPLTK